MLALWSVLESSVEVAIVAQSACVVSELFVIEEFVVEPALVVEVSY